MNKPRLNVKRLFLIVSIAVFMIIVFPITAKTQCNAPTLTFHSPVLISGNDGQQGAVYLFPEVLPGVDAHIEVPGLFGGAKVKQDRMQIHPGINSTSVILLHNWHRAPIFL